MLRTLIGVVVTLTLASQANARNPIKQNEHQNYAHQQLIDPKILDSADNHQSIPISTQEYIHPALRRDDSFDGPMPIPKRANESAQSLQSDQLLADDDDTFTMVRMTAAAPWSPRIQPGILEMFQPITYKHWYTKVTTSQKTEWLIFFEGSMLEARNGSYVYENDVWASGDEGETWDLIAGISQFGRSGRVVAASPSSFTGRAGATNCEDPSSDYIFSLGGYTGSPTGKVTSNSVFVSNNGLAWYTYISPNLTPRYFSSCDVDRSGHLYTMGGITVDRATGVESMLNDVWSNYQSGFYPQTLKAPWQARAEHLVLIASNTPLGREIIYVIGGMLNPSATENANDVWASSDGGVNWQRLTDAAPFGKRWGHGGVITNEGVIVVFGGSNTDNKNYNYTYTYRDVHASFDGGKKWHDCRVPSGDDSKRDFLRTEQGVTLLTSGRLMIASGYSFCPYGECPYTRYNYNDVWITSWSLEDSAKLARMCRTTVPKTIGLQVWPGGSSSKSQFIMRAVTYAAPWSQRIQPALLRMSKPISYTQTGTGLTVSTPADWLLLYEGSQPFYYENQYVAENDVWASGDDGATWDLVAGRSIFGSHGYAMSSNNSFIARAYSTNCEDPSNDDVYSISGTVPDGFNDIATSQVWYSSDAQHWVQTRGFTFSPARYYASCDVTDEGVVILIGGVSQKRNQWSNTETLNDVWLGYNKGQEWEYAGFAPFEPRAEHLVLHTHSKKLRSDVVYVIGGYTKYDVARNNYRTTNDIWVTSDLGYEWAQIEPVEDTFSPRWGHGGVITPSGIIAVIGGAYTNGKKADSKSLRDVWLTLDGGNYWSKCRMPAGVEYIRTEQGAQVTEDGRLILVSGYALAAGGQMRQYRDIFITDFSLDDIERLDVVCEAVETPVDGFIGLREWPGTEEEIEEEKESGLVKSAIILAVLVGLAIVGYCGYQLKHTGKLPLPWSSSATSYNELQAPAADFSAFSFGDSAPAAAASSSTH